MPLVAVGFLYEYYPKLRSLYRPRRRLQYIGMTLMGIGATLVWGWSYANNAAECLASGACLAASPEQRNYTAEDVVRHLYTSNLWIYLGLSLLLVALPLWDQRPQPPNTE
jgi:hypothetical protein